MHLQSKIVSSSQDNLNPIFEYAAQGQSCEKRMAWHEAVRWYERSLACLPNLFGADKKIRPLLFADSGSITFKPQHASRIYEELGRALMALDRREDGILAYCAARALDPNNISAQRFIQANAHILKPGGHESGDTEVNSEVGPDTTNQNLGKELTLVMVTHCTGRLKKFASLSPPSSKLVTATYGSLLKVFGEDIDACPKIMCYDLNPNASDCDTQYAGSIESFSRQNEFIFRSFQGVGLFNVLNQTVQSVDTPYIFFVEHDWMFRGGRIQLPGIIEMMNIDPNINAIRFNKRDNYLNGQDFLMSVDTIQKNYPLIRTSQFSNNPSIIRTDKLKNEWLPICEEALHRVSDKLGGSAFGVEEILFRKFVEDIRAYGFEDVHRRWGTYIFGGAGDPPRIIHLGE